MAAIKHYAESVSEFLACAQKARQQFRFRSDDRCGPWFRGHQRAEWSLSPRIFREYGRLRQRERTNKEDEIREEFIVRAPVLCESPPCEEPARAEWEWYFMAQHFGTPTRLLDWTEGALIALYFAVKDNPGHYDAAVWALDPYRLNNFTVRRNYVIPPSAVGVTEDELKLVQPWLPHRFTKRRLPPGAIAVYPTHTARRISTQRSCFTIHGGDQAALDKLYQNRADCLMKIFIPARCAVTIRQELDVAGIDEATIYPDLTGLGRAITLRWKLEKHPKPHEGAFTRLRPSKIDPGGVGVFAIRPIKKNQKLFEGDCQELMWIGEAELPKTPPEIRRLYDDFSIIKDGYYACPPSLNRLTISWYLNEPLRGKSPNVRADPDTFEFFAARNIKAGEELTVSYSAYSGLPATPA